MIGIRFRWKLRSSGGLQIVKRQHERMRGLSVPTPAHKRRFNCGGDDDSRLHRDTGF